MKLYKVIKNGKTYIVVKKDNGEVRVFKFRDQAHTDESVPEPDQCRLQSRPHSRGTVQLIER